MKNQEKIKHMLAMQQRLNDETNGTGWENGITKDGKIINWRRCIYMECAELIDSFAWKHWKNINANPDEDNVKIEIIDIWHFIMSLFLGEYRGEPSFDELSAEIAASALFGDFCKEPFALKNYNQYEIVNEIEMIIHITSTPQTNFESLLKLFFGLALKCGVNLEVLFEGYIAKNVLNKFRQNHGYKEGRYKKVWDGKEDNTVLCEIIASGLLDENEIYAKLEKIYKEIK